MEMSSTSLLSHLHPDNPHTPYGATYSSFHLRPLLLLRTALQQERSIAHALHPWCLLGKPEPSCDIWEAGSPCCASASAPTPEAAELGQRPSFPVLHSQL